MTKKNLLEDIKARPARFYRMPADILRDRRFVDSERLEILRAWTVTAEDGLTDQLDTLIADMESRQAAGERAAS